MQIRLMFVLILTNPVCLLEEKKKKVLIQPVIFVGLTLKI